jgi:hypothetical protein
LSLRLFIDKPHILEPLCADAWLFHKSGSELLLHEYDGTVEHQLKIMVYDWNVMPAQTKTYKPDLLIEMFGAGLPEKYLSLIFNKAHKNSKKTLWLNLEHLTAEPWAIDYHKTASYSPDSGLERYFFMPGFTAELGGLIIDSAFLAQKKNGMLLTGTQSLKLVLIC